ncbi:putative quinol monooxygenase [Sphaerisporangium sp. NPDC004334]
MHFTVVKFTVRPERDAAWLSLVEDITQATRAEPGNVLIEWFKSVDNPHQYVVVEGYASPEAAEAHTNSEHLKTAIAELPDMLTSTPEVISAQIEEGGWSPMSGAVPR